MSIIAGKIYNKYMMNFKVSKIEQTGHKGIFTIEPLEIGFGHTLGNCLRRVLLSSLEGAAITSVKIDGVHHQFSTINGISEDVIEIILNLKKVRVKLFSNQPAKFKLKASGKGEVKARDIDTMGNGEIINPDLHLASLNTPAAKLSMELTVEKGVGFVMANEKEEGEIGLIPTDAIFSPVLSVNYQVDPTRVGRKANFEKLTLEIITDGTIKAEEALNKSAEILSGYLKQIFEPVYDEEVVVLPTGGTDSVLKLSVEELDLPVRITNALKAVEIEIVSDLISVPRQQLLKAKNLGVQSINLISEKLEERGLSLREA